MTAFYLAPDLGLWFSACWLISVTNGTHGAEILLHVILSYDILSLELFFKVGNEVHIFYEV